MTPFQEHHSSKSELLNCYTALCCGMISNNVTQKFHFGQSLIYPLQNKHVWKDCIWRKKKSELNRDLWDTGLLDEQ